MARDILCVGNAVADSLAQPVKTLPKRGQLQLVAKIGLFSGGCAVNTSIGLSRLGMKAGIVTGVGNDGFGDFLLKRLNEEGVFTKNTVRFSQIHSSATLVTVHSDGERSFLHTIGASALLTDKHIPDSVLKGYRAIHVSGFFLMPRLDGAPTARLLKRAKKLGLITGLDTCWDPSNQWKGLTPCLKFVDYFMPSLEEAKRIFGLSQPKDIVKAALKYGVQKAVILKMGSKGCFAVDKNGSKFFEPVFLVKAVDATGAGDNWDAGFWTGILKRWDLKKSLVMGNATGAHCVMGLGASGNVRSYEQVLRMAKKNF